MSKEWFIAAHEELIAEYLEEHPDADEDEAYEATADKAGDVYADKLADYGDYLHDVARDRRMEDGQ